MAFLMQLSTSPFWSSSWWVLCSIQVSQRSSPIGFGGAIVEAVSWVWFGRRRRRVCCADHPRFVSGEAEAQRVSLSGFGLNGVRGGRVVQVFRVSMFSERGPPSIERSEGSVAEIAIGPIRSGSGGSGDVFHSRVAKRFSRISLSNNSR